MTETHLNISKSRHGFHPCTYDELKDLKRFRRLLYRAYRDYRHWQRWMRKDPQNRSPAAPNVPWFMLFATDVVRWSPQYRRMKASPAIGIAFYPVWHEGGQSDLFRHVDAAYHRARRPVVFAENVVAIELPGGWRGLADRLAGHYGEPTASTLSDDDLTRVIAGEITLDRALEA